jgi:hypothetical protein
VTGSADYFTSIGRLHEVRPVSGTHRVQRFTPELIDAARPSRHVAGNRWFVDETYLKVAGRWVYLYRAIDSTGRSLTFSRRQSGIWRRPVGSLPGP